MSGRAAIQDASSRDAIQDASSRDAIQDASSRDAIQGELTALARGDRSAFDSLFRRVWPIVSGFAARCLPGGEADDAAQEAMLRIFARASEFDPGRPALPWIVGVAAWQIRTHRTRARRRREAPVETLERRPDGSDSPEERAIAAEFSSAIDRALAALPRSDAETLVAYARGERPDLPGATFRKRVQRALVRLRAQWRVDHGDL